jgi:hypothetical protein
MWLSARQKKSAVRPATSKASHSETTILSILATEHLIPPMTTNMARLKADRITRGTTVGSTTTPGTATRARLFQIVAPALLALFVLAGCDTQPEPEIATPGVSPTIITFPTFTATPIVIFQTVIVTATPTPDEPSSETGRRKPRGRLDRAGLPNLDPARYRLPNNRHPR